MNATKDDIEKFDAYLEGNQTAEEKLLFESALLNNPELNDSFELHRALVNGIVEERETHLRSILKEQRSATFIGSNTWSKKFTMVAAAIMLLGISVLFISYLKKTDSINTLAKNKVEETNDDYNEAEISTDSNSINSSDATPAMGSKDELNIDEETREITQGNEAEDHSLFFDEADVQPSISLAPKRLDDISESNKYENKEKATSSSVSKDDFRLLETESISADKLLKSANTAVRFIDTSAKQMDIVIVESASRKKDKASSEYGKSGADVSDSSALARQRADVKKSNFPAQINITYFKSPLNYKGYSFVNNKISVYGLKDTTSILYTFGEQLYLKNAGIIYHIKPSPVFTDYIVIKEKAIIERLK